MKQRLVAASPREVPLPSSPLARVIAQVKFPAILAIRDPDKVAIFQEGLRDLYPNLIEEQVSKINLTTDQTPSVSGEIIWRLSEGGGSPSWRVSLATGFVALETTAYESRTDFLQRLKKVLSNLEETFRPAEVDRLGLRYIDQIQGEAMECVNDLVEPKILGLLQSTSESDMTLSDATERVFTQAIFHAEEGLILGRWGNLPPNTIYDSDLLDPVSEPSWILDLDMYTQEKQPFECTKLIKIEEKFSERIYYIFRKMVTNKFLEFYGGVL